MLYVNKKNSCRIWPNLPILYLQQYLLCTRATSSRRLQGERYSFPTRKTIVARWRAADSNARSPPVAATGGPTFGQQRSASGNIAEGNMPAVRKGVTSGKGQWHDTQWQIGDLREVLWRYVQKMKSELQLEQIKIIVIK